MLYTLAQRGAHWKSSGFSMCHFVPCAATRDRLQHLPREQRQQAAADMALRIAGLLSLDDGDGDEDS